jgi:hypothetical protein
MPWAGPLTGQRQEGMDSFVFIFSIFLQFDLVFLVDQIKF